MATKRQYLSGAAKRKAKKQRIESEAKGKRTLEEFGWKAIARAVDCEEDDEISLDTGCSHNVLPTAHSAQQELTQEQPEHDCEKDMSSETSGDDSFMNHSESDDLDRLDSDDGGWDLSTYQSYT